MRKLRFIVEKHADGYVAYPLGLKPGVAILGQGETFQEALEDAASAVGFTLESLVEDDVFEREPGPAEVFIAEAEVPVSADVSR